MSTFRRFPLRYPTKCLGCNLYLSLPVRAYGRKDEEGKWLIMCMNCMEGSSEEFKESSSEELLDDSNDDQSSAPSSKNIDEEYRLMRVLSKASCKSCNSIFSPSQQVYGKTNVEGKWIYRCLICGIDEISQENTSDISDAEYVSETAFRDEEEGDDELEDSDEDDDFLMQDELGAEARRSEKSILNMLMNKTRRVYECSRDDDITVDDEDGESGEETTAGLMYDTPLKPNAVQSEDEGRSNDSNHGELREGYLYCYQCSKYYFEDDFSVPQKKCSIDKERYCLRHSSTSSFGTSYRKASRPSVYSVIVPTTLSLSTKKRRHNRGRSEDSSSAHHGLVNEEDDDNVQDEQVEFTPSKRRLRLLDSESE